MKKTNMFVIVASIVFSLLRFSYGQVYDESVDFHQGDSGRVFVLNEAKDFRKAGVAVEGYLVKDVFEVKVEARIFRQRPRIADVKVVGPKLGRKSYQTKESILAGVEESDPIETTHEQGFFRTRSKRKTTKKLEGAVTKELFKIKIPVDKIVAGKRYWLWVYVESKNEAGHEDMFKFELKDFPDLIAQSTSVAVQ